MGAVLVTGGTGIVGGHLLLELAVAGTEVRALHREGSDRRSVEQVFRHYRPDADALLKRVEWVTGDLDDVAALHDAMAGVQHPYHAAAVVSFDPRYRHALDRVNRVGTENLVNAALRAGVGRLLHVSSTATIGNGRPGEAWDEGTPWEEKGRSPYALSKYAAELEVYRGIAEGLDAVIVNPCVVIGPGAPGRSSMVLAERLRKGTAYYPPGANSVVDARDVAACMVRLMRDGRTGERHLLVGASPSYRELFAAFAQAYGRPVPTRRIPPWALAMVWRLERVRTLFGGRPLITRHTAASAITQRAYDAAKVKAAIDCSFRGLDEMTRNVADFHAGRRAY